MTREFILIPSFIVKWKNLGLGDDDMRRLEEAILEDPKVGPVVRETGGVRKMRFAFENQGKSGSVRVIYVDFEVYEKVYFLDAYQKSDKENLTKEERNNLKKAVEILEFSLEKGNKK